MLPVAVSNGPPASTDSGATGNMDDIDARIVACLIKDARASYALVGSEVGLSAPAVKRRVDRLRATGAITGFSARVDPVAMGWTDRKSVV